MTEKEIVRALRCCAKGLGHDDKCENCKVGEIQDRRETHGACVFGRPRAFLVR